MVECPTPCKWWYPKSLEGTKETICHNDYDPGSCYEIGGIVYPTKQSCIEAGKLLCRPKGIFTIKVDDSLQSATLKPCHKNRPS